jgi:hypothetical protein
MFQVKIATSKQQSIVINIGKELHDTSTTQRDPKQLLLS